MLTALMWGVTPMALKSLVEQLDPYTATLYRYLLCLVATFWYLRFEPRTEWRHVRDWRVVGLLILCVAGLVVQNVLFLYGLERTSPGAAQVLGQLGPIFLLLGSVLIFREPFTPVQWLGGAIVMAGLLLFFADRLDALADLDRYGTGVMILCIAPFFWAAYGLAQKRLTGRLGSQQVLIIIYVVGTLAVWPLSEPGRVLEMSVAGHAAGLVVAGATVLGYIGFNRALLVWEASRVSAIVTTTPLFTLVMTTALVYLFPTAAAGEQHGPLRWVGAVIVVVGSLLAALPRRTLTAPAPTSRAA